jgi:hypothetical protein
MTSTYLSVDLDYWGFNKNQRRACTRFFNKLLSLDVPILVVNEHHHMLDDVNSSKCSRIEHIDFHADLSDRPRKVQKITHKPFSGGKLYLNCGTWLNYVKWRKRGDLIWRYPTDAAATRLGHCHYALDPFVYDVSEWPKPRRMLGLRGIPWNDIARVGVAISDEWWWDWGETYEAILPQLLDIEKAPYSNWRATLNKKSFKSFRRKLR